MSLLRFLPVRHLPSWEVQGQEKLQLSICSIGSMIFVPDIYALTGTTYVITNLISYVTDWRLCCRMCSCFQEVYGKIYPYVILKFQRNVCLKLLKLSVLILLLKPCQEIMITILQNAVGIYRWANAN